MRYYRLAQYFFCTCLCGKRVVYLFGKIETVLRARIRKPDRLYEGVYMQPVLCAEIERVGAIGNIAYSYHAIVQQFLAGGVPCYVFFFIRKAVAFEHYLL